MPCIKWLGKGQEILTAPSKAIDSFRLPQFEGKVISDDRIIVPKAAFKEVSVGQLNN